MSILGDDDHLRVCPHCHPSLKHHRPANAAVETGPELTRSTSAASWTVLSTALSYVMSVFRSNLRMQRFEIDARLGVTLATKHPGSPFQKLRFPLRDLIGMDVKLLRQLGQCQLALDGGQSHPRLECRCVVPARSSAHRLSCSAAFLAAVRQKLHLSCCADFRDQL